MGKRIFISYRREDGDIIAHKIYEHLAKYYAFEVFLDKYSLSTGEWEPPIMKAIEECDVFIAIITNGYLERLGDETSVIRKEFELAMEKLELYQIAPYYNEENRELVEISSSIKINEEKTLQSINAVYEEDFDRKVFDICETAILDSISDNCRKKINNWRNANSKLLSYVRSGDSKGENLADKIERTIEIEDKKYKCNQDGIASVLNNSDYDKLCMIGDGGAGKTYILHNIFDVLYQQKNITPIYVKLSELDKSNFIDVKSNANPILNFVAGEKEEKLKAEIFRIEESNSNIIVFLLDGLNEVKVEVSKVIDAIRNLGELSDKIRIILTSRYFPSELDGYYTKIKLCDLTKDEIKNFLGIEASITDGSVLRLPLYLKLYKLKRIKCDDISKITKYGILYDVFIKGPTPLGKDSYTEAEKSMYSYFLPFVCFKMTFNNILKGARKYILDIIKEGINALCDNAEDIAFAFTSDSTDFITFDNVESNNILAMMRKQVFHSVDDDMEICHQDVRDFFAAYYIKKVISLNKQSGGILNLNTPTSVVKNTIALFGTDKEIVFDEDATEMIFEALNGDVEKIRFDVDCPEFISYIAMFNFLCEKYVDRAHNGSDEKKLRCETVIPLLKHTFDVVCELSPDEILKHAKTYNDILYKYAEVERRLVNYADSVAASEKIIEMFSESESAKYKLFVKMAKHNIIKCKLYRAHADADKGYSQDVERLYSDTVVMLKSNSDFEYSANLYSMLLATPDPMSAPYMDKILCKNMVERRFEAFKVLYAVEATEMPEYRIQNLISYILHGYVQISEVNDIHNFTYNKSYVKDDADWGNAILLAEKYIETLPKNKVLYNVWCFKGIIALQKGEKESALTCFEKSFRISDNALIKGSYLGCFLYSVLVADEEKLNICWKKLEEKIPEHSVDSFDCMYILEDFKNAWNGLSERTEDFEIDKILSEQIDAKIKYLIEKSNEEVKKWAR